MYHGDFRKQKNTQTHRLEMMHLGHSHKRRGLYKPNVNRTKKNFLLRKNKGKEIYWLTTFKTRHYPVHGKKHVIASKVRAVHGSSPRQKCSNCNETNNTSLAQEFRKPCVYTLLVGAEKCLRQHVLLLFNL